MSFSVLSRTIVLSLALALASASASAAPPLPKGFDTDCVENPLIDCRVTAAGMVTLYGDINIAFQIQNGDSDEYGFGSGVVLFEDGGEEWTLFASEYGGVIYELPRLVEGEWLILHVPGWMQGTGNHNADLLFVREHEDDDWQRIDIESWREDVIPMLPEGLEIWKGVDFDFGDWFWRSFNARTPLWRQSDANCCATGGWAEIEFDITDGRLVPVRVYYRPQGDPAQ